MFFGLMKLLGFDQYFEPTNMVYFWNKFQNINQILIM